MKYICLGAVAISGTAVVVGTVAYLGNPVALFAFLLLALVVTAVVEQQMSPKMVLNSTVATFGNLSLGWLIWVTKNGYCLWGFLGVLLLMLALASLQPGKTRK